MTIHGRYATSRPFMPIGGINPFAVSDAAASNHQSKVEQSLQSLNDFHTQAQFPKAQNSSVISPHLLAQFHLNHAESCSPNVLNVDETEEFDSLSDSQLSSLAEEELHSSSAITNNNNSTDGSSFLFSEFPGIEKPNSLPNFGTTYAFGNIESMDITRKDNILNKVKKTSNSSESSNSRKRKNSSDSEYSEANTEQSENNSRRRSRERGTKQPRYLETENQVLVESHFMLSFQDIFKGNKVLDSELKNLYETRLKTLYPNKTFVVRDESALARHHKSLKFKEKNVWKYVDTRTEFGMHLSAIEELVRKELNKVSVNRSQNIKKEL